jgi:hypothetical protein
LMINLKKEKEAMETKFMKKEQKQNSRDWNWKYNNKKL